MREKKFARDKLIRFSITVPESLLNEFESSAQTSGKSANRSERIRELMRKNVVSERWRGGNNMLFATVTIVYDHHLPELVRNLTAVQHDHGNLIICSTHVHINHTTCLECVITKGNARKLEAFINDLESIKGIKSVNISSASEL